MMNCKQIVNHLQEELDTLKTELDELQAKYNESDHMDRIGMAHRLDKLEDKYYHFWMICNDIGIVPRV